MNKFEQELRNQLLHLDENDLYEFGQALIEACDAYDKVTAARGLFNTQKLLDWHDSLNEISVR